MQCVPRTKESLLSCSGGIIMAAICGRGLPFRTFDSFAMLCELLNDGQAIALSSWDAHGSDAPSLALETMLRFSGITATRQSSTSYLLYDGICFSPTEERAVQPSNGSDGLRPLLIAALGGPWPPFTNQG